MFGRDRGFAKENIQDCHPDVKDGRREALHKRVGGRVGGGEIPEVIKVTNARNYNSDNYLQL